jgi:hypothetical protein
MRRKVHIPTLAHSPCSKWHTGYSLGQQCLWSSQHVAPSIGQHPQARQNFPSGIEQQQVVPSLQVWVASHCSGSGAGGWGVGGPGGGFGPFLRG